jgi:PKD repeat protein
MNRILHLIFLLSFCVTTMFGQNQKTTGHIRCSTVEHTEAMRQANPQMQSNEAFEQWMQQKLQELQRDRENGVMRRALYQVPYIVHVVHSGQPVGTGDNLSAAQVNAQMQQINDDFNRLNSDAGNTPAVFLPVAAGLDIEFVPAVVDEDGNILSEPGINRINGQAEFGISSWGTGQIDATLKPNTYWDPNFVFNIWCVNLGGGLLGYAQFPEAPSLPGIGTGNGAAETDGVVVLNTSFGSISSPGTEFPYDLGRTLTHELGHWVGLRHVWGDGGCAEDDFCDDTPTAGGANFSGLPCTFPGPNSCTDAGTDLPDMFQNYMDYSDDACMNIFTQDQVDRIIIVLENSPRRNELLTSTAGEFPAADTVVAAIDKDVSSGCADLSVTFADNSFVGDEAAPISSWEWNFDVDGLGGASPSTFSGQSPGVVVFSNEGTYSISLTIDNGVYSNSATTSVTVEGTVDLDLIMGFQSGIPATWTNDLWQESNSVGFNSSASIFQDNVNNSSRTSAYIETPSLDFDVEATFIKLTFDYAHAFYGGGFGDEEGLEINVSTNCGETWEQVYIRLNSDPEPFYTTESTEFGWEPNPEDWAAQEVDLTAYKGNSSVRVQFHGVSDYGNDTYLDNINIEAITVSPDNIDAEFTSSASIACEGQSITFTDASVLGADITEPVYEWNFDLNSSGTATPATYTGETPPAVVFETSGIYTIELTVSQGANSDTYTMDVEIGGALDLPLAEDFESGVFPPTDWTVGEGVGPAPYGFSSTSSIFINNYDGELRTDINLPAFDFTNVGRADLSFDLAHTFYVGFFGNLYDTLAVAYSLDCGGSWTEIWRKDAGNPLDPLFTVPGGSGAAFIPASDEDWRNEVIDVTSLQGNGSVQFRFEGRGAFGNNIFLDNINIDAELVAPDEVFAYFTSDASGGCVGSAITFSDLSTAGSNTTITSWEWNFDLNGTGTATPSTFSGETPPPVSFDEPGDYTVQLTVSDGVVSDSYTTQISIEVPVDLAYTQNFAEAAFPPTGWTNVLWEQAAQSTDPLLGSLFANNYGIVGLKASAFTPSFDLSWYDQIALTFDVSHARFSGAENEGLVINSSSNCGSSWDLVWSKYDFDAEPLYTAATTTAAFFPEGPADWREETVDLSPLNDLSSVKLEIFNDGFFGNNTFVDDILIEGWLFNPTNLTATLQGTNNIQLNWVDNSGKESDYEVLRWNDVTASWDVIASLGANSTSYLDQGLSGEALFTYQVCAFNEKARACSNEASDSTEAILVITGLVADLSDESGTSIELTWTELSTTEEGFIILRSEDGGVTWTEINVLTANQSFYLDQFLDETVTYTYQVCAFNALDTVCSNTDDETTEINAPSDLSTTAVDVNIVVSWTDNSSVEDGFQITRSLVSGGPYAVVAVVPANVTTYTDYDLVPSTEFCYEVCAYNTIDIGCSGESCATTDVASAIFEELSNAITMYPNPASTFVDLGLGSIKGSVSVKVFNPIGEVVKDVVLSGGNTTRMEVADLAAGVYMIRLQTAEGFTTKKLVIQ